MAKKKIKDTGAKLNQQLRRRAIGTLIARLDFMRSTLYSRLSMLLPTQLRWMIPFLESELDMRPPTFDEMVQKFKEKEALEEIPPEVKEASILEKRKTCLYLPQKYRKYDCLLDNPFNCKWTQKSVEEDKTVRYCFKCGFPAILAPERKIQGAKGRYEIQNFIGHRNEGRIYQGIQIPDQKPVIIKEYILPKISQGGYFNDGEINQRKELFERLAGLKLYDGREIQDFRLITPYEAIADGREERCYIIIKQKSDQHPDLSALYQSPTLASYIDETGALNNYEVWRILNQVLQSLEFLHNQKFRHPDDSPIMGVAHGNITLESLLITFNFQGFFIYLSDLAVWETRFELPDQPSVYSHSFAQDLKDLGRVAFYLLAGKQVDPETSELLEPQMEANWGEEIDKELKQYILNLMGLGVQSYSNATQARQALLKLKLATQMLPEVAFSEIEEEDETKKKKKFSRLWLWLIGILGGLALLFLLWFLFLRNRQEITLPRENLKCCIGEVAGVSKGNFTFQAEENGIWNYIYTKPNLIVKDKTLEQEIAEKQPELQLRYQPENSPTEMLTKIKNRELNFAITSQISDLEDEYESRIFAYDGLVIFIPFSYSQRDDNIPSALKGKISFSQVRQLYTGKISNWNQLGGPDLPVKLYLPPNDEAISLFEKKVLQEDRYIQEFRELISRDLSDRLTTNSPQVIRPQNSFETLRRMIQDFEKNPKERIGGVGFDSLSKVFGQCSVYPLAIVQDNFRSISPLLQTRNNKQISPQTDLCRKGSYIPNVKAFITQQYPLAYPLGIVYLKDNSQEPIGEKFAEILTTKEAQEMLFKTGLVPIQPLE
jgi:ABC-type phosphate transport system substrate-binding protein